MLVGGLTEHDRGGSRRICDFSKIDSSLNKLTVTQFNTLVVRLSAINVVFAGLFSILISLDGVFIDLVGWL